MIRSMTGFGRAEKTAGNWRCGVEVRSVNSRFLEVRLWRFQCGAEKHLL